jgi:hypothetical protein
MVDLATAESSPTIQVDTESNMHMQRLRNSRALIPEPSCCLKVWLCRQLYVARVCYEPRE